MGDAFVKAMHLQTQAKRSDFLGRLCALVPDPIDAWLIGRDGGASPVSMPVKMLLMLALAKQLGNKGATEAVLAKKIEWINELWLAFDVADEAVARNALNFCGQLLEVLENAPASLAGGEVGNQLRYLKMGVSQASQLLNLKGK